MMCGDWLILIASSTCLNLWLFSLSTTFEYCSLLPRLPNCLLQFCYFVHFRILSQLKHPHIVSYHESFFDPSEEYLYIIQDYCDGGNMDDKIKEAARVKCVSFKGNRYPFRKAALSKLFCLPSAKGSTLKAKNLLPRALFQNQRICFHRVCSKRKEFAPGKRVLSF